jgi:hypothetical protein
LCTQASGKGKASLNELLEKVSISMTSSFTMPQIADKLVPLSNDLQEISSFCDKEETKSISEQ